MVSHLSPGAKTLRHNCVKICRSLEAKTAVQKPREFQKTLNREKIKNLFAKKGRKMSRRLSVDRF